MATAGIVIMTLAGLAIIALGFRFLIQPRTAITAYGIGYVEQANENGYLAIKGVRDIVSGLIALMLIVIGAHRALGWFALIAALIPVSDCLIVLRYSGNRAIAFGVHGATAATMLVAAALLLLG